MINFPIKMATGCDICEVNHTFDLLVFSDNKILIISWVLV